MMMNKMCAGHKVAFILLVVGGLNWGLVALGYNLVEMVLGMGMAAKVVYGLVGVSAIMMLFAGGKCCQKVSSGNGQSMGGGMPKA